MADVSIEPGRLYVVATPLGNLADISERAARVLRSVDLIAAEDTRHSAPLLRHLGSQVKMIAYHEHNERRVAPTLVARLEQGQAVALISDAGTPLLSDPGYHLIRLARAAGLTVVPVPGPCALICALSVAGLATDRFVFEGFLPAKTGARRQRLEALRSETRTLGFYESPHRIVASIAAMREVFGGEREAVVARELTKVYETIRADTLAGLEHWLGADPEQQRGEFVVLVAGVPQAVTTEADAEAERILRCLLEELPVSQAAALGARITGLSKNALYRRALALTEKP